MLVRWDEVDSGYIGHALRFVVGHSQMGFVWPATHAAGTCPTGSSCPPMGLRVRLKGRRISCYWRMQVILRALKVRDDVADNGGGPAGGLRTLTRASRGRGPLIRGATSGGLGRSAAARARVATSG